MGSPTSFRLSSRPRRWLQEEPPGPLAGEGEPDWDVWLLRALVRDRMVTVGGIMVDRQVLAQRFACVSERCAPGPARGGWRSCCADLEVALSRGERAALRRAERSLSVGLGERGNGRDPWLEGGNLARPGGRCVCSRLDRQGRIRCRLRLFARAERLEQSQVQPLVCRLFPLILVRAGAGRPVLTLVDKGTCRLVGTYPPGRFPCLSDPSLPPLVESMRRDLDWLFGRGFARALERQVRPGP